MPKVKMKPPRPVRRKPKPPAKVSKAKRKLILAADA